MSAAARFPRESRAIPDPKSWSIRSCALGGPGLKIGTGKRALRVRGVQARVLEGKGMLQAGLERTTTWLERKLAEGRDGRLQVYRHIASLYARPLAAYMRESPWRRLGDIRHVVFRFFAERIFRKESLLRWVRRDVPLRRWLVKAFAYYLVELSREAGEGSAQRRSELRASGGNPELAYHTALAESLVRVALIKTREDCKRRGMEEHWKLFYEHHWKARPYREILAELGLDAVKGAARLRAAIARFRAALRELLEHDGLSEGSINEEIRALVAIGRGEAGP